MQKREQHVFSFQVDEPVSDKAGELVGYCQTNGLRVSDGLVMRALLMSTAPGPDFLGLVRARAEFEKEARREKRKTTNEAEPATHGRARKKKS